MSRYRPQQPINRSFTLIEIEQGINKLKRRIEEVKGLNSNILYNDARVKNAEQNIVKEIAEVFGVDSPEALNHSTHNIWYGGYNRGDTSHTRQHKFLAGIPQTIHMIEGLITRLEEKREDLNIASTLITESVSSQPRNGNMIKIFISHSSSDRDLVDLITNLLTGALEINTEEIRCTSIPGFQLRSGSHTSTQLRNEIEDCSVLIGVLTPNSMESFYVMFELGAGWGLGKMVIPICGPTFEFRALRAPLNEIHGIKWTEKAQWFQLIDELSSTLSISKKASSRISSLIDKVVEHSNS